MGKPSPSVPNPYQVANAQSAADVRTAVANAWMGNADETNPYGSVDYSRIGNRVIFDGKRNLNVPIFQRTVTLANPQQQMLNQQNRLGIGLNDIALSQMNRIGGLLGSPVLDRNIQPPAVTQLDDTAPLKTSVNAPDVTAYNGKAPTLQDSLGNTDYANQRQDVENAIYSRLDPQLQRDKTSLETNLVNQGFQRGSDAFNQQMDEFNRQSNDARMQAVLAGGQEQSRLAGLALQAGNFANQADLSQFQAGISANQQSNAAQNQAYQQAINSAQFFNQAQDQALNQSAQRGNFQNQARSANLSEQLALRNQPINEISALMNGGQVNIPQFPQFQYTPMSAPPVGQYIYQSAAMQNQANAAQMGGMYGLGSTLLYGLMGSDRRIKKNIIDLGLTMRNGAKLYAYEYLGEDKRRVGVMADELESIMPDAVHIVNGIRMVDYNMLMRAA